MRLNASRRKAMLATAAMSLVISAGCSGNAKSTSPLLPAPNRPSASAGTLAAAFTNLPKADPSMPDSQFVELDSGYHLATLFDAMSGLPPDYEKLAEAASPDYRSASDVFRKRDLFQALKPQIDQQIQFYKDPHNRYFIAAVGNGSGQPSGNLLSINHYDFNTSAFPITQDMSPDTYHFFYDLSFYSYAFTNGSAYQQFPMRDEQKAKEVEDRLTRGQFDQGDVTVYMFAQGFDTQNRRVLMQVVHMILHGPGKTEIARF